MAEDIRNMESTKGVKEFEKQYDLPHCVLLDSEYCSMGRMVGIKACEQSGYAYYDAVILLDLVKDSGITIEDVEAYEKKLRKAGLTKEEIISDPDYEKISAVFDRAIGIALEKGPCLIHDRATPEMITEKGYSCVTVLSYAKDMDAKIVRAKLSPLYSSMTDDNAVIEKIKEEDNIRINYHKAHSDTDWGDKAAYDLCINTDAFGRDYSAVVLAGTMKK